MKKIKNSQMENFEFAIVKIDKDDEDIKKPLDYKMRFIMANDELKEFDQTIGDFFKIMKVI